MPNSKLTFDLNTTAGARIGNLFRGFKALEHANGGVPGAEAVNLLNSWFESLGIDVEGHPSQVGLFFTDPGIPRAFSMGDLGRVVAAVLGPRWRAHNADKNSVEIDGPETVTVGVDVDGELYVREEVSGKTMYLRTVPGPDSLPCVAEAVAAAIRDL